LPFTADSLDRYHSVYWQGRRWAWVDPQKEVAASVEAITNKIKSRTRVIAETGEDIEDVFDEIAAEEALAKEKKINLTAAAKPDKKPSNDNQSNDKPSDNGEGNDEENTNGKD
jgi:capsid protein